MGTAGDVGENVGTDFEAFYAREYDRLVRVAYLLVGATGDPESLAQETFARVQPRFTRLESPSAYARTTLVNLCRRQLRRRNLEHRAYEAVQHREATTDAVFELADVIDRLSFRQKAVIVLRYFDDLSEESIAEALGCRPGTVKSIAHRALARMREELSRDSA